MTPKEIAIRKMEEEIQQKERRINQLQEELLGMRKKLEEYKNIPNAYYDTTLASCEDFPLAQHWCYSIGEKLKFGENFWNVTISDLLYSSTEELLNVRGLGERRVKMIEDWMEKHNIHFIS